MKGNILTLAITLTLATILVGSLMMPVIDASKAKESVNQEAGTFLCYATDEIGVGTYTVDSGTLKLNDESVTSNAVNIIFDQYRIIFYNGALTLYGGTTTQSVGLKSITFEDDGTFSYVKSDDTEVTVSEPIKWFMGVAPTGNYVLGSGSYSLKVNADTICYATSTTNISDGTNTYNAGTYVLNAKGKLPELAAECYVWSSSAWNEMEASLIVDNPVESSEGVYTISSNARTIVLDGNENTEGGMLFFAPYTYTVVSDNAFNSILLIIPVLMIIAMIIGSVGFITTRRD